MRKKNGEPNFIFVFLSLEASDAADKAAISQVVAQRRSCIQSFSSKMNLALQKAADQ